MSAFLTSAHVIRVLLAIHGPCWSQLRAGAQGIRVTLGGQRSVSPRVNWKTSRSLLHLILYPTPRDSQSEVIIRMRGSGQERNSQGRPCPSVRRRAFSLLTWVMPLDLCPAWSQALQALTL